MTISLNAERSLRYVPGEPGETRSRMREQGAPDWLVGAQLAIAEYQRQEGQTARVTGTVEDVLGRPPGSFRRFAEDHVDELFGS